MKRCARLAAVISLCFVCLAGCNGAWTRGIPGASAVSVGRKGQISAWFVEEFAEEYYSLAELAEMATREADEYNAMVPGGKAAVTVEKVELLPDDGGKIMVNYRFDGWESYTDFNGQILFYGTAEEAVEKGYGVGAVLKSVTDGSLLAGDWLSREADGCVIVTDVKANIYCPGKVTHISDSVSVNEDGSIDTSEAEGTVYILMK